MKSSKSSNDSPGAGVAFLLAQVGAHAAARFAEHLEPLKLIPPHAGILRAISRECGISQQSLAKFLGMFPSRMVLVLDEMERAGLIERKAKAADRRTYALHLTARGKDKLEAIGRVAREHQEALCAGLSASEREMLAQFLSRIADQQGLTPGVHPGFRQKGPGGQAGCG
jgi:DNA-binding MarR family transcriptional regulator